MGTEARARRDHQAAENPNRSSAPKKYADDHRNPWIWADPTANSAARNLEGWYQITFVSSRAVSTVYMSRRTHDELLRLAFAETRSRRNTRWVLTENARQRLDTHLSLPSARGLWRSEDEAAITTLNGDRVWVESAAITAALLVWCDLSDATWGDTRNKIPAQIAQLKKNAAATLADHDGDSSPENR